MTTTAALNPAAVREHRERLRDATLRAIVTAYSLEDAGERVNEALRTAYSEGRISAFDETMSDLNALRKEVGL